MLQRLFGSKSPPKDAADKHSMKLVEPHSWSPPPFRSSQIRVILAEDTGDKSKVPLFDTGAQPYGLEGVKIQPTSRELPSSWAAGSTLRPTRSTGDPSRPYSDQASRRSMDLHHESSDVGEAKVTPPPLTRANSTPIRLLNQGLDLIGDMMFGAVPMSYKGQTTKVHYLRSPKPQVLITKLFAVGPQDVESALQNRRSSFSSVHSEISVSSLQVFASGDQPRPPKIDPISIQSHPSLFTDGSCGDSSDDDSVKLPTHSPGGPPILGLHSRSRYAFNTRRLRRSSQTSIENGVFKPTPLPSPMSRGDSTGSNTPTKHSPRSISFALGILISFEENTILQEFLFSHFGLVELRLHQLQAVMFQLLCSIFRRNSTPPLTHSNEQTPPFQPQHMHSRSRQMRLLPCYILQNDDSLWNAVRAFQEGLLRLYATPRIQEPLWLNMTTFPQSKSTLCESLISELVFLIDKLDSKSNNLFLSSLITSVLIHHLSWVSTVAPPAKPGSESHEHSHLIPYDPLWAQLGDLQGNVGIPNKASRTIVVGQHASLVRRLLYVLTYFIRCNEVFEYVEEVHHRSPHLPHPTKGDPPSPSSPSSAEPKSISIPASQRSRSKDDADGRETLGERIGGSWRQASTGMASSVKSLFFLDHFEQGRIGGAGGERGGAGGGRQERQAQARLSGSFTRTSPIHLARSVSGHASPFQNQTQHAHHSTPSQPQLAQKTPRKLPPANFVPGIWGEEDPWMIAEDDDEMEMAGSKNRRGGGLDSILGYLDTRSNLDSEEKRVEEPEPIKVVFPPHPGQPPRRPSLEESKITLPENLSGRFLKVAMPLSNILYRTPDPQRTAPQPGDGGSAVLGYRADQLFTKSYGRSLMASYCERYLPDFVLMGVPKFDFLDPLETDLRDKVLLAANDNVQQSVCIVADVNTCQCKLVSYRANRDPSTPTILTYEGLDSYNHAVEIQRATPSKFVHETLLEIKNLHELKSSAESCVQYLEDRLQELYFTSFLVSSSIREGWLDKPEPDLMSIASSLGIDESDMQLLFAICTTHDDRIHEFVRL
ncbi:uncharacterized protein VTP21DRAFT_283 [Calcarisporiella thermophila]|uniref:uncharacterized protein n=1 Tax=Calcarisporiella thermophila TaxID=911321 RepID=UPI0037444E82